MNNWHYFLIAYSFFGAAILYLIESEEDPDWNWPQWFFAGLLLGPIAFVSVVIVFVFKVLGKIK